MLEPLIDRWAEKHLGPGRPVPRWMRGLLDETFLWVAAGQLLLALGVPRESVRRLGVLQEILEEYREVQRAQGVEVRRLEEVTTLEELDLVLGTGDEGALTFGLGDLDADPETFAQLQQHVPATTLARWIEDGAGVLLDLAEQVLDGLLRRRVRTELIGMDHRVAAEQIRTMRDRLAALDLPALGRAGHEELLSRLEQTVRELDRMDLAGLLEVEPVVPRPGEVGRILDLLDDLPRETRDRLIPIRALRSRLVLAPLLTRLLAESRAGWVDPDAPAAPAAAAEIESQQVAEEARARRAEWEARQSERRELGRHALRFGRTRIAIQVAAMLVVLATGVQVWVLGTDPDWAGDLAIPRIGIGSSAALLLSLVVIGALCGVADLAESGHVVHERPLARRRARTLHTWGACGGVLLILSCLGAPLLAPGSFLRGGEWYRELYGDRVLSLTTAGLDPGITLIVGVFAAAALGLVLGVLLSRGLRRRVQRGASSRHPAQI